MSTYRAKHVDAVDLSLKYVDVDELVLHLSRYINENRADYYRLLLDVTARDSWEPWILYMLAAVLDTSRWTQARIEAIAELMAETTERLRTVSPKIYSRELVEVLCRQPYCRIQNLVEHGLAKRETASRYLRELAAVGLVRAEKVGRDKLFVNKRFLEVLLDSNADHITSADPGYMRH